MSGLDWLGSYLSAHLAAEDVNEAGVEYTITLMNILVHKNITGYTKTRKLERKNTSGLFTQQDERGSQINNS